MTHLYLALGFSTLAAVGSLYLSLGLKLKACPLCFYQRTFAFGLVAVLTVGLWAIPDSTPTLLLAFPLAVGAFGVALFHSYLVWSKTLECPPGLARIRSAPEQSLFVFAVILLCFLDAFRISWSNGTLELPGVLIGLALGVASVYGSIVANPAPPKPTAPYTPEQILETCRVPFKA